MPFEGSAISILKAIAKLSPQREWYPPKLQRMQQVTWPEALFSSTALEAFRLVVEKLIFDSERLRFLFPGSGEVPTLPQANLTLIWKYYWRSREFIGKESQMDSANEMQFEGPPKLSSASMNLCTKEFKRFQGLEFLRSLVECGHEWRTLAVSQDKSLLSGLLLNCEELNGASGGEGNLADSTISTWRQLAKGRNFVNTFLDLYNLAREAQHNHRETFTLLLLVLAYLSVNPLPLSILHCVAVHATEFKNVTPPKYATFQYTSQAKFEMAMVTQVVKTKLISYDEWMPKYGGNPYASEFEPDFHSRVRKTYEETKAWTIKAMTEYAQRCWPNDLSDLRVMSTTTVHYKAATGEINQLFACWRHNMELHTFVANVEKNVVKLCHQAGVSMTMSAPLQAPINIPASLTIQPFHLEMPVSLPLSGTLISEAEKIFETWHFLTEFNDHGVSKQERYEPPPWFPLQQDDTTSTCEIARRFSSELESSWREHCKVHPQPLRIVYKDKLAEKLRAYKEKSESLWTEICVAVQPRCNGRDVEQAGGVAGLWRRAVPVVLLPCIMNNTIDMSLDGVQLALGALAVIWTLEQQVERCLRMLQLTKNPLKDVALQKELVNTGHVNWLPKERPKWLILELEGDFLMRSIQVDVAKQMLCPPRNENAILRLNMGEGKTSVIVPALCASIPDGERRFARLTVLGSLFRMNFDALVSKLGGLLNQRVYTFPYRRDISINASGVQTMYSVYQECIAKHGVVVMRPEHRLSTILKGLEFCRADACAELAIEMRNLHDMVEKTARDILDESDLLLHVKYQVVYIVGEPGRWGFAMEGFTECPSKRSTTLQ